MSRTFAFADAAGNTLVSVDRPGTIFPIESDCSHRAISFALTTEETFLDSVLHVPGIGGRQAFGAEQVGFHYFYLRRFGFGFRFRRFDLWSGLRCFRSRRSFRRSRADGGATGEDLALVGGLDFFLLALVPSVFEGETVGRALVYANAAGHALVSVNGPGAISSVQRNSFAGTCVLAFAAEEAFFYFIENMSIRYFDDDLLRSRRRRFRSGSGSRRLWRGFSHGRYAFHGDVGAIA